MVTWAISVQRFNFHHMWIFPLSSYPTNIIYRFLQAIKIALKSTLTTEHGTEKTFYFYTSQDSGLPLYILWCTMLEVSTTSRKPPKLTLLVHPVLSSFYLSKAWMVDVTTPNIVPTCWPSYRYLVVIWWGHQTEQAFLLWWANTFKILMPRSIQFL